MLEHFTIKLANNVVYRPDIARSMIDELKPEKVTWADYTPVKIWKGPMKAITD